MSDKDAPEIASKDIGNVPAKIPAAPSTMGEKEDEKMVSFLTSAKNDDFFFFRKMKAYKHIQTKKTNQLNHEI